MQDAECQRTGEHGNHAEAAERDVLDIGRDNASGNVTTKGELFGERDRGNGGKDAGHDPCGALDVAEPCEALGDAGQEHSVGDCGIPADCVVERDPEGEDQDTGCRTEPSEPPVHAEVLAAIGEEDGKRRDETQWVEPFKAVRGSLGKQSRGQDCKPGQKIERGEIGCSQRAAADLRGWGWDRCRGGAGETKPGDVVDRDQEGQGDATEENPTGLGVEAAESDIGITGIPNCDEHCEPHQVEQPTEEKREGNQHEGAGKPQFASRVDEPSHGEAQHESQSLNAGALVRDNDGKCAGADHKMRWIIDYGGGEEAKQHGDAAKSDHLHGMSEPGIRPVPGDDQEATDGHHEQIADRGKAPCFAQTLNQAQGIGEMDQRSAKSDGQRDEQAVPGGHGRALEGSSLGC